MLGAIHPEQPISVYSIVPLSTAILKPSDFWYANQQILLLDSKQLSRAFPNPGPQNYDVARFTDVIAQAQASKRIAKFVA